MNEDLLPKYNVEGIQFDTKYYAATRIYLTLL